ncbi:MAG: response regulator [Lachnospiraceae bacterium]|nr:response regulator [Lachnospiraceae bacterium]
MYKILLVDDEYFAREALRHTITWEEYGCTICGEANNGKDGIEQALALQPDIVLADINMPFMDGLEMTEQIRKLLPETICVIVTGYSEFEYARRGMELGVKYFVVKPVDDEELIRSVQQMVDELDIRKEQKKEYNSLRFWAEKNADNNRRNFLRMVLEDEPEIPAERFLYECEHLNLPIEKGGYGVCCLKVDVRNLVGFTTADWDSKIMDMVHQEMGEGCYAVYCSYDGGFILFGNVSRQDWNTMQMRALMQKLQIRFMKEMVCTVVAGVGEYCEDYGKIPASRAQAEQNMTEITTSPLITKMLEYIHEHYTDSELTLNKIAQELYANYSYLSAQFAKEIGMTVSQYILRFRMTRAADALCSDAGNMVKIAWSVGYLDVKYFYRCFKKEFGITPYQYVELVQKKERENGKTKHGKPKYLN